MGDAAVVRFVKEVRRRGVLRLAGLYIVGLWLLMQAADILFPAWGIPDAAIRYLLWAGLLGFPVAMVFGWVFDISAHGIRRTQPVGSEDELLRSLPLRRLDYVVLAAFVVVVGAIVYDTAGRVLETATTAAGGPGGWRPAPEEIESNSVAVLPFTNLSADPEQDYFAHGISEEILNRLSVFRELKVIARTSSFAFQDSGYDIARISGLLAVNYLLQGSVRRDGPRLRISAQLVDRTGVQVWSNTFDRELQAIFGLQDEIAEAVATSILPQIVPPLAEQRLPDLAAYDAYLIGREMVAGREPGWPMRAMVHFDRAIAADPQFAEPYAERAVCLAITLQWAPDTVAVIERAQRDIDTALVLKPGLARAFAAQALLLQFAEPGSAAEREALLRRALAADPNHVDAMNWLSGVLYSDDRADEADEILERALRLDPLAPVINANWARREAAMGRFAEAEQRLLRMLELPQVSIVPRLLLIDLYREAGRLVDAARLCKRTIVEAIPVGGSPLGIHGLIEIYAMLGLVGQAEEWRTRSIRAYPDADMMRIYEIAALNMGPGAEGFRDALEPVEAIVLRMDPDLADLPHEAVTTYGSLLALGGEAARAINVLGPLIARYGDEVDFTLPARQDLAWAYLQAGNEAATAQLDVVDRHYREKQAGGRLHLSDRLAAYAMNTLLMGDQEQALQLLARAVEAGWRRYYHALRDPRWDGVREMPAFQDIMTSVKADLDRQRAQLEAIDADDDFDARYEAALAMHAHKVNESEL